ncbi:MAG: carboxypeptidase-like regulatory domain-containing protein, partial [Odoribacter sp.]|nr:carboxypeptidase-like regulatory domain-containing protein [Odoribacter sp.]
MKLIAFFFFAGLLQVSATTFGQQATVVFQRHTMTIEEVFATIRKQLSYDIFYNNEVLDDRQTVRLSSHRMEVESVLKEILQGKFSYELIEKNIIIRPIKKTNVREDGFVNVIKGKVVDMRGEPLPGVTIRLDSTNFGGSTDANGEFELSLKLERGVLVFSFIGFESKRVSFGVNQFLRVTLEEQVMQMEEVVINGMFTQNKNSYTG